MRGLIEQQAAELAAFSHTETRTALRLYRETRGDLMQRLEFLEGAGKADKFTAQQLRVALAQVNDGVRHLEQRTGEALRSSVQTAAQLSGEHLAEQARFFGNKFKGTIRPIATSTAMVVEKGTSILLPQFQNSVDRYGTDLIRGMQQRMAVSLLSGESAFEARTRLFTDFLQPLRTVSLNGEQVPVTAYWGERIARTESASAYNTTFQAHLTQAGAKDKALRKRWTAAFERTCQLCMGMNGVTVEVNDPFILPSGYVTMTPPGHPNCMCATLAWMDAWDAEGTDEFFRRE